MADELTIKSDWPVSTIDGVPSIQHGSMDVIRNRDGSVLLNGSIGRDGAPPEDHEYFQFLLEPHHTQQLIRFLVDSAPE